MARIEVDRLEKSFGTFQAVRGVSFVIPDGSFFCLLGPSGCGKTTTLRMIAGLELPTAGRILLGSEDVTFRRAGERDIAFVFQLFALYPHMNVRDNIAYPLRNIGMGRAEIRRRVEEAARSLRIEHLLRLPVGGLSGGDRQRVALGRAIVREPAAFLMDEPLGALDAEFRHLMCGELRALHNRLGATTAYVTHDQAEAMAMADLIAVMNQGVVEQLAPPQEIYDRPNSRYVAEFIGSPPMGFLEVDRVEAADRVQLAGALVPVPAQAAPASGAVLLGIRPEHVRLDAEAGPPGRIEAVEYLGTTQIITIETPSGRLRARLPSTTEVHTGQQVRLSFRTDRISLFDGATGRALARRAA